MLKIFNESLKFYTTVWTTGWCFTVLRHASLWTARKCVLTNSIDDFPIGDCSARNVYVRTVHIPSPDLVVRLHLPQVTQLLNCKWWCPTCQTQLQKEHKKMANTCTGITSHTEMQFYSKKVDIYFSQLQCQRRWDTEVNASSMSSWGVSNPFMQRATMDASRTRSHERLYS